MTGALEYSYHGIAARLDRLPEGSWQGRVTGLLGALLFCDCLDQYVGSGILATLLESSWSTTELNALCVSGTMLGYLVGSILAGCFSDLLSLARHFSTHWHAGFRRYGIGLS